MGSRRWPLAVYRLIGCPLNGSFAGAECGSEVGDRKSSKEMCTMWVNDQDV